jgi:hypothetical protein
MLAPLTSSSAAQLLSPSARVLVASALPDCGASVAARLPWSDVHWPTLVSLVSFERAESQVYALFRAAPAGAVPEDVLRSTMAVSRVAAFRSAELSDAAAQVCDALGAAGIDAVWLKGAALAMQAGEGFGVRSMGDLDVLVLPEDQLRARETLVASGWLDSGADPTYDGHHHDAPLTSRAGIRLELHSGLFTPGHPFTSDLASVWLARSREVSWGARVVRVLPTAWHLVHASVHWAWSHEGEVGSWQYLHDAHVLRQRLVVETGWEEVERAAQELAAFAPVGWALWTASRLGGVAIPEALIDRLRGRSSMMAGIAERAWVLRALYSPSASPSITWSRFWWRQAMHGLGDDRRAWPWSLGRGVDAPPQNTVEAAATGGSAARLSRWRRHLARVLRG